MKNFGENLKSARTELNMNQQALGQAIGVGQTTIANYEKGVRFPTGELLKRIAEILNISIDQLLDHKVVHISPELSQDDMATYQQQFRDFLLEAKEQEALLMIWELHPSRENLFEIYEHMLVTTMVQIGNMWEAGVVNVAVEHYASQVVHKIISMLSTITSSTPKNGKKAICMSLNSEPHTIGMRMISEYLNYCGLDSYFIGTSVPTDSLIEMMLKRKIHLLALSATMQEHLDALTNLIARLRGEPRFDHVKILVGGQAFVHNPQGWEQVGADGYANDFDGLENWLSEEKLM